jgi:hypothetical protein
MPMIVSSASLVFGTTRRDVRAESSTVRGQGGATGPGFSPI